MAGDISDVAAVVKPPKNVSGRSVSIAMTGDHCLSSFTLGVQFDDVDGTKLVDAPVVISDGTLGNVIDKCYAEARADAEANGETPTIPDPKDAEGPEIKNPNYPVKPNAQQMWTAAQNKLNDALEDEATTGEPTLAGKLAAVADIIVNLLASGAANPGGAYPQKWGKRLLKNAYYAKARSAV